MWDSMAFLRQCVLAFLGLSAGLSVASGVFTVFTAVGLVPRFAEHTKSSDHILRYENAIILGCFLGNLFSLFAELTPGLRLQAPSLSGAVADSLWGGSFFSSSFWNSQFSGVLAMLILGIAGIFTGIYVGTLAVSIAEMLDAIPIMVHRINLRRGVSLVITGLAIGKLIGSLFYYMNGVYGW